MNSRDPSFDGKRRRKREKGGKENARWFSPRHAADIFRDAFVPGCRRHRRKKDTDLSTLRFLSDIAFTQRRALPAEGETESRGRSLNSRPAAE